jgi:hypothetical protein
MGEHKRNPCVLWREKNPNPYHLSKKERRDMKREARDLLIEEYFQKNPRKPGPQLDGGWLIRGKRWKRAYDKVGTVRVGEL